MQVIVLGPHRSGTSLVTRLVNLLGAHVGDDVESRPAEDNPKGFWESRDGVAANNAILAAAGCAWDRLAGWRFEALDEGWLTAEARASIRSTVEALDAHRPWVLKDPRLCLTLPFWQPFLSHPVAVVVARHPAEVAVSLRTRDRMSFAQALAIFEYSAVGVLRHAQSWPTVRVTYDAVLADPLGEVARLKRDLEACGVSGLREPDAGLIRDFVDAALHRSHVDPSMARSLMSPRLDELYDALRGTAALTMEALMPSVMATSIMEAVDRVEVERQEWNARLSQRDEALAFLRGEREHAHAVSEQARADLVGVTAQRDELARGLAETHAGLATAEAEMARVQAEKANVLADLAALRAQSEKDRVWMQGLVHGLEARIGRLQAEDVERRAALARLDVELAERQAVVRALTQSVGLLTAERDGDRARLQGVLDSRDYRWARRVGRVRRALGANEDDGQL